MSIEAFPNPTTTTGTVTSVSAGEGLTASTEPITTTGTIDLDIDTLTTGTVLSSGDYVPILDVSAGSDPDDQRKITADNFRIGIDTIGDYFYHSWDQYQGGGQSPGGSTAIVVVGHSTATTTSGAANAFNDATGGYVDLASTSGVADTNATHVGPADHTLTNNNPTFGWVFKTGTDVADIRMYFIYGSATPYASDDPAIHMVGFRGLRTGSVGGVHDTNWQAVTKDGATAVGASDTGVAIATNTRYRFLVVTRSSGTSFDFYIDDVLVATRSTNLPSATQGLAFHGGLRSRTTTAKSWRFRKNWLRQI